MGPLAVGIGAAAIGVPLIGGQMLSWWTGRQKDFEKMRLYHEQLRNERATNLKRGARAARKTAQEGRDAAEQELVSFHAGKVVEKIAPTEAYAGETAAKAQLAADAMKLSGGPAAFGPEMGAPAMNADPRVASLQPVMQQIGGQLGTRELANAMWDYNSGARPHGNSWATLAGYPEDFTKGIG